MTKDELIAKILDAFRRLDISVTTDHGGGLEFQLGFDERNMPDRIENAYFFDENYSQIR